ncbi:MAG: DUF1059 domain-containing protein [Salinigranum sp.]
MVKQVSCREAGLDCDFEIHDENEDELIEFVRQHARDTHDMEMSRDDVREYITETAS